MKATITIKMDNAAFDNGHASELGRILRKLAERIEEDGPNYAPCMDSNGNKVGEFNIQD